MKQYLYFSLTAILLANLPLYGDSSCNTYGLSECYDCEQCCLGTCDGYPFLQIRSQGRNTARQMVGQQEFMHIHEIDCMNGVFSVGVEYTRTFQPEKIARFYFGKDIIDCCNLYVQGSQVEKRKSQAWLADYFGLPTDYESKISFCPKIENIIVDLDFYLGLDELAENVYFRMNMPVVSTKWELCLSEKKTNTGGNEFPAKYMTQEAISRNNLPKNFLQTMSGETTFGDMKTPLKYGLLRNGSCSQTGIAEIDFILGWNCFLEKDYHFGIFAYVSVPTGTRPHATYLFEPIIGNGKHWELGGGLSGSWISWRGKDQEDHYLSIYMEAVIAHLFRASQCRSFDFCSKPSSRYMLLGQMGANNEAVKVGTNIDNVKEATYQYQKSLIPAINWATFNVDVKIDIQADIAIKLGYTRGNVTLDLGYNLYARTGERFCCNCYDDCCRDASCCNDCCGLVCDKNCVRYAIKGDSYMYGTENTTENPKTYPIPFSQTEASIYHAQHTEKLLTENARANTKNDNILPAWSAYNVELINTDTIIKASQTPVLLTRSMLNIGKSPSMFTHKFFAHIGYTWKEQEKNWVPFIGVGGEVEFTQDNEDCCWDDCCNDCYDIDVIYERKSKITKELHYRNCDHNDICKTYSDDCNGARRGISQWGIWVKGGIAFH